MLPTAISRRIHGALGRAGYELRPQVRPTDLAPTHPDLEPAFTAAYARCAPFTMTSVERMYALWQGIAHIEAADVVGDVVECGVWRGGSSMLAALGLQAASSADRQLWLFDTFEGMSEPTEKDVQALTGEAVADEWSRYQGATDDPMFAYGALSEVQRNMQATGYPAAQVHYVQGKVEDTIPQTIPERIALLRLDTDWYESTRHELEHLWDRLEPGGVLIIDDYGHWAGAREAVDEFFAGRTDRPLLNRIDYTGRIGVKR